jgi:hypothetical protein
MINKHNWCTKNRMIRYQYPWFSGQIQHPLCRGDSPEADIRMQKGRHPPAELVKKQIGHSEIAADEPDILCKLKTIGIQGYSKAASDGLDEALLQCPELKK